MNNGIEPYELDVKNSSVDEDSASNWEEQGLVRKSIWERQTSIRFEYNLDIGKNVVHKK